MAMSENTIKVINYLQGLKGADVTANDVADALGLTEDGVYWSVKQLRTKCILRRIGGRKEGHWEVVE